MPSFQLSHFEFSRLRWTDSVFDGAAALIFTISSKEGNETTISVSNSQNATIIMNLPPCEAKFEVPLIAVINELLNKVIGPEPVDQKRERWKEFLLLIRDLKSCHSS